MLPSSWVASTKPGAALVRGQGWLPGQGRGWFLAPRDRGPGAGVYLPGENLDRDLLLLRLAEALGHHLEESPGDLRVRLDKGAELPGGEAVAGQIGVGRDRRGAAGLFVDQGNLAEVIAGCELSSFLPVNLDARCPVGDHEEAHAAGALQGHGVAGIEVTLLEGARQLLEVAPGQPFEERDLFEQLDRRAGHGQILRAAQATL